MQASQSLSQPIQINVSSVYLPTTTSTLDPGTNAATIATVPLPSFAVSKDNSQFEVPEGNVVHIHIANIHTTEYNQRSSTIRGYS